MKLVACRARARVCVCVCARAPSVEVRVAGGSYKRSNGVEIIFGGYTGYQMGQGRH